MKQKKCHLFDNKKLSQQHEKKKLCYTFTMKEYELQEWMWVRTQKQLS